MCVRPALADCLHAMHTSTRMAMYEARTDLHPPCTRIDLHPPCTRTRSVFLGVVRPMASSTRNVRCWVAPSGVILCGDQQFASMIGVTEGEVVSGGGGGACWWLHLLIRADTEQGRTGSSGTAPVTPAAHACTCL